VSHVVLDLIRAAGLAVAPGLTDDELAAAEAYVGVAFPPDLRALLAEGMPADRGFPNWRVLDDVIDDYMTAPLEGIHFDIEHNAFWWSTWGERPARLEDALAVATEQFARVPKLLPIYGHRYLAAEPYEAGNPVFSVHQTDVIVYGDDLRSYFEAELSRTYVGPKTPRFIPFWSELDR
jgi:hypothetical protein